MKSLRNFNQEEITEILIKLGEPKFRGKQLYQWVSKGADSFEQMKNIPKSLKDKLETNGYTMNNMWVHKVLNSKLDGTRKYLMKLADGNIIECVLMRYKHGNSICISTQVGCRMGCSFCASTIDGRVRNLTAGEMLGQILAVGNDIGERISNVVLMGSGEPLDNFDHVMKFLELVNDENGLNISMRSITLSTCGMVEEIKTLMSSKLQLTLAISLHAVDDGVRDKLIPINKKYPIKSLIATCREYIKVTGRRITFEFSLIANLNDDIDTAHKLGQMLKGMNCHVNLIPINPIEERDYKGSNEKNVEAFKRVVKTYGIETTVRRELGRDINAACGQLRRDHL